METQSRIFKVIVQFQEKDEVFYTRIKSINGIAGSLLDIIIARYPSLSSLIKRCYVNDKEGSQFSIINNEDLCVFLDAEELFENIVYVEINGVNRATRDETSPPKRVRIEEQNATTITSPAEDLEKAVHPNVVCDCCDAEIVGFRYKCTECFNFDLCMACESKMRHRDHTMLRIPAPVAVLSPRDYKRRGKKCEIPSPAQEQEKHGRHHHHGKRHHHRRPHHAGGFFDGFFRQLNEENPVSDVETTTQEIPSTSSCPFRQPETNFAGTSAAAAAAAPIPPPYDFHKLVKVVEAVAGNVSKLFDPLATLDAYGDCGTKVPPTSTTTPTSTAATTEEPIVIPVIVEKRNPETDSAKAKEAEANATSPATPMEIHQEPATAPSASPAVVPEATIIDVVEEVCHQSDVILPTTDAVPMSPNASNNSDDAEWLVISNEGLPEAPLEQNKSTQVSPVKEVEATASTSAQTNTTTETSAQTQGYDELARKLQKDIEEQLRLNSNTAGTQTSVNVPANASAAPPGPIVFHPAPHINASIHRMMDMGFSNDGGCLTELMACCNGDIRRALDSLLYKK